MAVTRRGALAAGGIVGAGLLAGQVPGTAALAGPVGVPVRRSLQGLAWNDPILETYRDAVRILKAKPAADPLSWVGLCSIHGGPSSFKYCPHGDWYFLPWHRAFTVMYERIVRSVTGNPDFAMPFWDWTANPLMPEVFLSPATPDGRPNPLHVDDDGVRRTWPADRPMPSSIVGRAVLDEILGATPYEVFGTSRNPLQDSSDPDWVPRGGGVQGTLEATPHNNVHNLVGGWMPTRQSPRDPLFFMHHCNIDRIWALWSAGHQNSAAPLWTEMTFTEHFRNPDGSFWSPKVSDLQDPEALGYSYGLRTVASAAAGPDSRTVALGRKLDSVLAPPTGRAATPGVVTASVANASTATSAAPLSLPLPLPAGAIATIARRAPSPSGTAAVNSGRSLELAATGPRALVFLRDVAITDPSTTSFRVFVDQPDLGPDTADTAPGYVGTVAVLDHGSGDDAGHRDGHAPRQDGRHVAPSFVLDITDAIQRVHGASGAPPAEVRLQLLPVSIGGGPVGTARPTIVEVAVAAG
ncbi:tyrosinase family protein [Methylobacterium oryzae]|uniref:Monooxygenase n=1 Tax=Methylobacterium oryzae TaxID=334852 RepID=A0ABU7TUF6_9HYPH